MTSDIEVFTTPSCPYCVKLKRWLDEEGYEYREYDVSENREKAVEMIQMTGQRGVPQTIINGKKTVLGFQPEKIEEILAEDTKEDRKKNRVEELEQEDE